MWLPYPILFRYSDDGIASIGLPHSAIQGSQDMCSFPWLFAAYHGLLRLVAPRHPPYTYCSLDHIIVSSHFTARPPGFPFRLQAHATSQACRAGIPHAPFSVHESYLLQIRVPAFRPSRFFVSLPSSCQISRAVRRLGVSPFRVLRFQRSHNRARWFGPD